MSLFRLKINLFGELWRLHQISCSAQQKEQWQIIAHRLKTALHKALIDPYFYYLLQDDKIKTVEDLEGPVWEGLLNNQKNQIEIWYKNKKVQKLTINNLRDELLLFPLYNTSFKKKTEALENGIYIEQRGIGLVGTYEIELENFNIDELEFQIIEINDNIVLQSFKYKDKLLKFKKNDILLTFQNGFEINQKVSH